MAEVVVTLKGDGSPPWIVLHGETLSETEAMIEAFREAESFAAVQGAAAEFAAARPITTEQALATVQATFPGAQVMGGYPGQQYPQGQGDPYGGQGGQQLPQQFQPGGQPQVCMHGPMQYVATGKFGPFWACPLPRDTPGKCKARNAR